MRSPTKGLLGVMAVGLLALALPVQAADVTPKRLLNADREVGNWIMHHRTFDGQRYSPLSQINKSNVGDLQVVATSMLAGIQAGGRYKYAVLEGTPIAEDGFLYVTDGWNNVYKIDVRSGDRATIVWRWDPEQDKDYVASSGCCQARNRGVALWGDQVIQSTMDGRMVGLNKDTGELVWEVKTADNELMESHTGAPLVIGDIAINGVTGAEYGIRGHLDAIDLNTGQIKWTTYTIPAPGEPGNETWEDKYDAWKTGGGSIWQTGSYDPALNLTYWGVGNPSPQFDSEYRPGDNLYTESTIALDVDTGEIKWHFQYTPNDPYDYDEVGEAQLIDIQIGGEDRNLAVQVARNGFTYGFDRANGQFLYAVQYAEVVNWTTGIDQKTGRPLSYDPNIRGEAQGYVPGTPGRRDGRLSVFCPHLGGGKNWQPAAYNRDTQLLYTSSLEACSAYTTTVGGVGHWADKGNKLGTLKNRHPAGWRGRESVDRNTPKPLMDSRGSVTAIDPRTGTPVAKVMTRSRPSGILTTAGGLVFSADDTGDVYALDANTLETLWTRNLGTGIAAPPMSYSYGGKQYIAVLVGKAPGSTTRRQYPETAHIQATNMLFVFAL